MNIEKIDFDFCESLLTQNFKNKILKSYVHIRKNTNTLRVKKGQINDQPLSEAITPVQR